MYQSDLPELIELLKKDENSNLRKELAEIVLSTIEKDIILKDRMVDFASQGMEERRKRTF